jgi:hypothetical protein
MPIADGLSHVLTFGYANNFAPDIFSDACAIYFAFDLSPNDIANNLPSDVVTNACAN